LRLARDPDSATTRAYAVVKKKAMALSTPPPISSSGPQVIGAQFSGIGVETPDPTAILSNELTDAAQAWFESPEWQGGEDEADADLAAGRITRFDSEQAFLDAL
jgi:hypothetical protein